jgi:hypothetical protein
MRIAQRKAYGGQPDAGELRQTWVSPSTGKTVIIRPVSMIAATRDGRDKFVTLSKDGLPPGRTLILRRSG